jgi:hypothetical protein
MPTSRRSVNRYFVALLAGMTACKQIKDVGGAIADLAKLKPRLVERLGHQGIELTIVNGTLLRILVVNSPLSSLAPSEKQAKSLEIAKFAYEVLGPGSGLSNIAVAFATKRPYLFLFQTQTVDSDLTFPVSALASSPDRAGRIPSDGAAEV